MAARSAIVYTGGTAQRAPFGRVPYESLVINAETVGITGDPYPWQGVYFQGVPVEVSAIPQRGYRFAGWEGLDDDALADDATVEILLDEALRLTARFEADAEQRYFFLPLVAR